MYGDQCGEFLCGYRGDIAVLGAFTLTLNSSVEFRRR